MDQIAERWFEISLKVDHCRTLTQIGGRISAKGAALEEQEAAASQSLPTKRPRSLTIPAIDRAIGDASRSFTDTGDWQQTLNQHQSPLMWLPYDVRRMIWEEAAVSGRVFHFIRCPERLLGNKSFELVYARADKVGNVNLCCVWTIYPLQVPPGSGDRAGTRERRPPPDGALANFLPMLQTCRLIYSETIELLYRNNIFAFEHLEAVQVLRKTTLRSRLDTIRIVCLDYRFGRRMFPVDGGMWPETCETFAGLAGLQSLYLQLHGEGLDSGKDNHHAVLEPLRQITHVKTFKQQGYKKQKEASELWQFLSAEEKEFCSGKVRKDAEETKQEE
ncbi:hypothetical protein EV356DRAFT_536488 [Viridothelium virens]|uniref:DUF7730 domain-containing protein n=1 Tax=Viridothelium virens TaxID=1048519 RepID=A0A6A6GX66_VIRVR|nr:hypothetical protein EV356DRAFT_536488 [Viridothelium virens]